MGINKFEISIERDSDNNDAKLDAMSVEVAKAFLVLVESLTKIVENSPNSNTLKIEVHKGSVRVGISGIGLTEVKNTFIQVSNNQSSDQVAVASWRNIQKLLKSNHLAYKEDAVVDDQKLNLLSILKNRDYFRTKDREKPALQTEIKFFEGSLEQMGGISTNNIHLKLSDAKVVVIDCTPEQLQKSKRYFKQIALVSAWQLPGIDKPKLKLCNSYYHDDLPMVNKFKAFFYEFENSDTEIESLERLHTECINYLQQRDFRTTKKFLQLFNHDSIHLSIIHTLLMLVAPHKNNEQIKTVYNTLIDLFNKRVKKLNRKPEIAIENSN